MSKIHVKGKHNRDPLRDPTPEEMADALQSEGAKCGGIAKLQTEFLERRETYPEMIYASPLPKDAWRQIAERIWEDRKSMAVDSRVYEDATIAMTTARLVEHGTSVWDALVAQCECCEQEYGMSRREAQGILRHHAYIVSESYAGRIVG
jgi:uncharacterized Fe-S radical SAM superfamily protein PflX